MRSTARALILLLFVVGSAAYAAAQTARGTYQFTLGDKLLKYAEFDCKAVEGEVATGRLLLSDEATIVYRDVDGDGSPEEKYAGFSVSVELDEMIVNKNQAVMSGVVRDATIPYLIGQRVLFTVEDNGADQRVPDRLTWGLYQPIKRDWTPSDAEWKEDPGVGLRWWATDVERRDDVGYEMPRGEAISSRSFPLSAYLFVDTSDGVGDIIVVP